MTLTLQPRFDVEQPDSDVGAVVSAARQLLGRVVEAPATGLADNRLTQVLTDLVALRSQVDELASRIAVEVDQRGIARDRGASSTAGYLATVTGTTRGHAASMVARGGLMTDRCEPTRIAWASGDLTGEQAEVIARAVGRLGARCPAELVERGQYDLAAHACALSLDELKQVANRWVEVIDPDAADAALDTALQAEEQRARLQATFTGRAGLDGVARFSGRMPNLQFAMLKRALEAIASPRRRTGVPTDAAPAVGPDQPSAVGYATRLGLALCELVEHLPTDSLPQHGVTNATIVVTVDHETLRDRVGTAALDTGCLISPGEVRRLACNAGLLPAVLGADSAVLDLGRTRRLFSRHQRIALAVRDGGCVWPDCDRPAAWCEAHHLTPWGEGGPTDLSNAALVCAFHHHLLHSNAGWSVSMGPDHRPHITPPDHLKTAHTVTRQRASHPAGCQPERQTQPDP